MVAWIENERSVLSVDTGVVTGFDPVGSGSSQHTYSVICTPGEQIGTVLDLDFNAYGHVIASP